MTTVFSVPHLLKVNASMCVHDSGTVNKPLQSISSATEHVHNFIQPSKALPAMYVTEFGIVTDAKLEHPEKAPIPMDVTESGIVTDAKLEH